MSSPRAVAVLRVALLMVTAAAAAGCASTVVGSGTPLGADDGSGSTSSTMSASSTASTTSSSTSTSGSTSSAPSTSAGPSFTPTDPNDPAAALAFQTAMLFVQRLDAEDLAGAYALLCPEDQADVTLEEFSTDPPPPGSFTFQPLGQTGPGEYLGTFTFLGESEEVIIRDDGSGQYCLSEPDD